ncbi:MAG: metallophosphoesterase family protein [Polyangiales bacterium]
MGQPDRISTKPASQPMAFLSDVHGNLPALEAVLGELTRRAVTDVFVAGDLLLGGEQPLEVWQRLQAVGAHCIRGTSDIALATIDPTKLRPSSAEEIEMAAQFAATRRALGELTLRRLAALPDRLRIPMVDGRELLLVHGSPSDPFESIGHDLDDDSVRDLLADDPADIVVCGSTHVPFSRVVDDIEVINVGSVGSAPEGAIAHFTLLFPKTAGATIEQTWVEI